MTLAVFPQLPGLGWPLTRSPQWQTGIQTTQSGRELLAGFMSYPRYKWSATFDLLRANSTTPEFQQLLAFFNACAGMATQFVFNDPDDNTATAQGFGTGNGAMTQYQVIKSFGGYAEPAGFINASPTFYANGSPIGAPTLNAPYNGWVTFSTPPASGAVLTWTGTYGYVCRFLADTYDFDRSFSQIYGMKKLEFISCKP